MHDDIAKIDQHPLAAVFTFDADDIAARFFYEIPSHLISHPWHCLSR